MYKIFIKCQTYMQTTNHQQITGKQRVRKGETWVVEMLY